MQKTFIAATLAALAVASVASGAVVANWTFETSIPTTGGPHAAEAGVNAASSFATGFHTSTATVYSNPAGNGSAESFSSNNWATGDYYQFTTSTVGYQNITIQWDQTGSGTGPRDFGLFYSVDGGSSFTQLGATYAVLLNGAPNAAWNTGSSQAAFTFGPTAGPASLNNLGTAIFRLTQMTNIAINPGQTVASGGTGRVDNVIISGDLVPTPGAISLVGLGGLVAMRRRR